MREAEIESVPLAVLLCVALSVSVAGEVAVSDALFVCVDVTVVDIVDVTNMLLDGCCDRHCRWCG